MVESPKRTPQTPADHQLDPLIKAILARIPTADRVWPLTEQVYVLRMLAMAFHTIYRNKQHITVELS